VNALEAALVRAGFDIRVEVRDRLALLIPRTNSAVMTEPQRRAVIALAVEHGFTHVALELVDE
jgi:hypothetical protein